MPARSAKQYRLMQLAAHGKSDKVPAAVARRFIAETPPEKRTAFAWRKRKR